MPRTPIRARSRHTLSPKSIRKLPRESLLLHLDNHNLQLTGTKTQLANRLVRFIQLQQRTSKRLSRDQRPETTAAADRTPANDRDPDSSGQEKDSDPDSSGREDDPYCEISHDATDNQSSASADSDSSENPSADESGVVGNTTSPPPGTTRLPPKTGPHAVPDPDTDMHQCPDIATQQ